MQNIRCSRLAPVIKRYVKPSMVSEIERRLKVVFLDGVFSWACLFTTTCIHDRNATATPDDTRSFYTVIDKIPSKMVILVACRFPTLSAGQNEKRLFN